jgi:hypothetical protein
LRPILFDSSNWRPGRYIREEILSNTSLGELTSSLTAFVNSFSLLKKLISLPYDSRSFLNISLMLVLFAMNIDSLEVSSSSSPSTKDKDLMIHSSVYSQG